MPDHIRAARAVVFTLSALTLAAANDSTESSPRSNAATTGVTPTNAETDWTFGGTWPYEPLWYATADGALHYIDEGPRDGRPIILVHGNPTWGYVWRNFIPALVNAGYRVIVPDHLGFGRSDKPPDPSVYAIQRHAARLEQLLNSLELQHATLVCHDWGGPIGLAWAARHPNRIQSLAILNTLVHRPQGKVHMPFSLRIVRKPIVGPLLVKGAHASVRLFLFHRGLVHPRRLGPNERAAYLAPHPTWSSRTGILVFPREMPAGPEGDVSEFLDEVHDGLMAIRPIPMFIAWGMKDFTFRPSYLEDMWLRDFPDAQVLRLPDAAHFVQEDAHETVVPALLEFLEQRSCPEQPRPNQPR